MPRREATEEATPRATILLCGAVVAPLPRKLTFSQSGPRKIAADAAAIHKEKLRALAKDAGGGFTEEFGQRGSVSSEPKFKG
jgi:hypothetical protein